MRRFNQNGAALITVLLLITIVLEISYCLLLGSRLNFKVAHNMADAKKALYAAEAGIEYGKYLIFKVYQGMPTEDLEGKCYVPGEPFLPAYPLNNGSNFTLAYQDRKESEQLIILAEGEYQGVKKKIRVVVKIKDS